MYRFQQTLSHIVYSPPLVPLVPPDAPIPSSNSLPEDLNTVTMQSIRNADLDSSTAEWIEAQLSSGASSHNNHTGEVKWLRLKEGLKGVVHRMASEVRMSRRVSAPVALGFAGLIQLSRAGFTIGLACERCTVGLVSNVCLGASCLYLSRFGIRLLIW